MYVSDFSDRVQAIFGVLEQPGSPVTWNLDKNVIFKSGEEEQMETGYESESEQEEEEEEFQRRKLMFMGSAVTENPFQADLPDVQVPTKQFTNAMDNELEEDVYDRIATQSYSRNNNNDDDNNNEPFLNPFKPPPLTDQPIESPRLKRSRLDQAFESILKNKIKAPQSTQITEIDQHEKNKIRSNNAKRVRFDVPENLEKESSVQIRNCNGNLQGSQSKNSSVKQTCYQLEQPLIVGGGLSQLDQQEDDFFDQFSKSSSGQLSLLNSNDFETQGEMQDKGMEFVKPQINVLNKQCSMDVDEPGQAKEEEIQEVGESNVDFGGQEKKLRKQRNYRKGG